MRWRDRAPERSADVWSEDCTALLRQVCDACSTETVRDGGAELMRRLVDASGGDHGIVCEKFRDRIQWIAEGRRELYQSSLEMLFPKARDLPIVP